MGGHDSNDDTNADSEQFEKPQLARDRDVAVINTADVDDMTAQNMVSDIIER